MCAWKQSFGRAVQYHFECMVIAGPPGFLQTLVAVLYGIPIVFASHIYTLCSLDALLLSPWHITLLFTKMGCVQGWEKVKSAAKSAVGGNQGVTK